MKIFIVQYDMRFGRGAYEEASFVVIANTEEEAKGRVLNCLPDHAKGDSIESITEVDGTVPSAQMVHWRES